MDSNDNVLTRIRQSVSISVMTGSMNGAFSVEKKDLKNQQISPRTRNEIPFIGCREEEYRVLGYQSGRCRAAGNIHGHLHEEEC